jgi:hypothetical protein
MTAAVPVLLAAETLPTQITLRIDLNPLGSTAFTGKEILTLIVLDSAGFSEEAREGFDGAVGDPIEYEIDREDQSVTVVFNVNFSAEALEVECVDVQEAKTDATAADLAARTSRLARLYLAAVLDGEANRQAYEELKTQLEKRLAGELDRCRRKIDFFSGRDPARAEGFESLAKGYESIRQVVASSRRRDG